MKIALTVAGSDSIGGAGIQADIKAMAYVGVHAATVLTAVTAQNTRRVGGIFPMPAEAVRAQIDAVLSDCDVGAVKTGMLYSPEIAGEVADAFEDHDMPLIVDPVMVATVGDALSENGLAEALKRRLMPACELVTPNRMEAEALAGMEIRSDKDARLACEIIGKHGSSVLLKGGHMDTRNVTDYLYLSSEIIVMKNPRLDSAGHGSGCALSALIAAHMAKGADIVNAVMESRRIIQGAIALQYAVGGGEMIVNTMSRECADGGVRDGVAGDVEAAAGRMIEILPHRLAPKGGAHIAFAKPGAAGVADVASATVAVRGGALKMIGPVGFGAAEGLSKALLDLGRSYPGTRCAMEIAMSDDTLDLMEEVGMSVSGAKKKRGGSRKRGDAPDAVFEDRGKESRVRILGKDPRDVISKLETIIDC
ncbi:MAG: bifunctional hydroxymethylpyrimidine kinase/phosphomethylpyrimidine kinase [Candidatus Methanoplasma sp.]|nr:bifunctional hydroxymethylpyrimidine kinase/phosphomethylpyrimidine kinase [Candidatus Methanoplasma sp.]